MRQVFGLRSARPVKTAIETKKGVQKRKKNVAWAVTKETKKLIVRHIYSHQPSISHYRREHAPNRSVDYWLAKQRKDFIWCLTVPLPTAYWFKFSRFNYHPLILLSTYYIFLIKKYQPRLYLPSELTVKDMHERYVHEHPANKVSYTTYRRLTKDLGISFTKLGQEQCSKCDRYQLHKSDGGCRGLST